MLTSVNPTRYYGYSLYALDIVIGYLGLHAALSLAKCVAVQRISSKAATEILQFTHHQKESGVIQMEKNRRFPRLLQGEEAAALSKLLYKKPEFFLTVDGDKGVTYIKFRISVPKGIRRSYSAACELFFGSGIKAWERALSEAYWEAKWDKKEVPRLVSNILRVVYKDALRRWLADSWDLSTNKREKGHHVQSFSKAARTKQGPQPDPRLALKVAKKIKLLKPAVRDLRNRLKKCSHKENQDVMSEVPPNLSLDTLRSALSKLGGMKDDNSFRTLLARGITDQQIVEEYVKCEMPVLIFGPRKPSMDKYVRLGEQLLKALSGIPRA